MLILCIPELSRITPSLLSHRCPCPQAPREDPEVQRGEMPSPQGAGGGVDDSPPPRAKASYLVM